MAKMYYEKDCDLGYLDGKKITIIGYGSQGHHPGGGDDLLEVDVEAVGEHEHIARLQVGGDVT